MSTTLTVETMKPCTECALLHPVVDTDPCPSCTKAIREGIRSGDMLNQVWFNRFDEILLRAKMFRHLSPKELKDIELFRQSMHRTRTPYPIPGAARTMTPTEWVNISEEKLRQYRRHVDQGTVMVLEALIASAVR